MRGKIWSIQLNTHISRGSATTDFRQGGMFKCHSSLLNVNLKELLELVYVCQILS